jgi:hypothetical protein
VQRHETDPLALAFGAIFVAIGGAFLFGDVDAFEFVSVWALPAVLFATGIVLGAVALARHRTAARDEFEVLTGPDDPSER